MIDEILKKISKTQNINKINLLVDQCSAGIERSYNDTTLLLILRALTDKGFKSHASMCSQEYYNQEDLDGDGEIYGHTFHYIGDVPPVLKSIPKKGKAVQWKDII